MGLLSSKPKPKPEPKPSFERASEERTLPVDREHYGRFSTAETPSRRRIRLRTLASNPEPRVRHPENPRQANAGRVVGKREHMKESHGSSAASEDHIPPKKKMRNEDDLDDLSVGMGTMDLNIGSGPNSDRSSSSSDSDDDASDKSEADEEHSNKCKPDKSTIETEKTGSGCSLPAVNIKQEDPDEPRASPARPETNHYMFLYWFRKFLLDLCDSNNGFLALETKVEGYLNHDKEFLEQKTLTHDAIQCYLTLSFVALKEQCDIEIQKVQDVIFIESDDCINLKDYLTKFKKFVECFPPYVSRIEDLKNEIDSLMAHKIRKGGRALSADVLELEVSEVQTCFKIFIETFHLY